ncbi:hypothetical protein V513_02810 [Mesotoga sp. H07.pep.5.3]|nr:hypothetical protein V513_02810 [Mesotoga sp. H07.pep.5.3]
MQKQVASHKSRTSVQRILDFKRKAAFRIIEILKQVQNDWMRCFRKACRDAETSMTERAGYRV